MRRRIVLGSLAILGTLALGCSDRQAANLPTSIERSGASRASLSANPTVDELIDALFAGPNRQSTHSQWKTIQKDVAGGNRKSLVSHVNNVTAWVFTYLANGQLLDPDGDGPLNATTGAIKLLSMIYGYAGVVPTQIPSVPAGWDAAISLVDPNSTTNQSIVTSFGDAEAVIPPGTFTQPVLLVIIRQPDNTPINTPFPRFSRVFDIDIAPQVSFNPFSLHTCPFETIDPAVNHRAVIAHQQDNGVVEYLAPPSDGTLTCPHDIGDAWRPEKDFWKRNEMRFASYAQSAWDFVGPKLAYAGHAAIGGSLGSLSPVVVVDPLVGTSISSDGPFTSTYGQSVHVTASLRVSSGPEEYVGMSVPGQTITASVDEGESVSAVTNSDGTASWDFPRLGAGKHTVSFAFARASSPERAPVYDASTGSAEIDVAPAPLEVAVRSARYTYGADACVVDYSGFVYDDTPESLSGTLQCTRDGEPSPVPSPSGSYTLVPGGLTSDNYTIRFVGGDVTVGYNTPKSFLAPIPNTVFNAGRTIPVKFQLFEADGVTPVTTAQATVAMSGVNIPASRSSFVYNAETQTYQVNVDTPRNLAAGPHTITATLDDGSQISVTITVQ
jgi:MBG domain (YGX type)